MDIRIKKFGKLYRTTKGMWYPIKMNKSQNITKFKLYYHYLQLNKYDLDFDDNDTEGIMNLTANDEAAEFTYKLLLGT